jgi:uncharacterized protein with HEPN domain
MNRDRLYLLHVEGALKQIAVYVNGFDEPSFYANSMAYDAVIRQLQIVGEASKKVSAEYKKMHPEVPWTKMTGMRDKLIHDYAGIDYRQVWLVATVHSPPLIPILASLLAEFQ